MNVLAQIVFPTTMSVEGVGDSLLGTVEGPVVVVLTTAVLIVCMIAVKKLVFRGVRGLAGSGGSSRSKRHYQLLVGSTDERKHRANAAFIRHYHGRQRRGAGV